MSRLVDCFLPSFRALSLPAMALSVLASIPERIIFRLVLQLSAIPFDSLQAVDWDAKIKTHIVTYGRTDDMSAFLDTVFEEHKAFQRNQSRHVRDEWRTVSVIAEDDFDFLAGNIASAAGDLESRPKPNPVGIRVELLNEQPRSKILPEFVTHNQEYQHLAQSYDQDCNVYDKVGTPQVFPPSCPISIALSPAARQSGHPHSVNTVMSGTLDYMIGRMLQADPTGPDLITEENVNTLETLVTRELERVQERTKQIKEAMDVTKPTTLYVLMGALMRGETESREWMLYARDFMKNGDGTQWKRVWGEPVGLGQDTDVEMVSEGDVLRHLQGKPPEPASAESPQFSSASSFSTTPASVLAHVPWYLFYINRDSLENQISTEPNDPPVHINLGIPRLAHDTTMQYTDTTPVHSISAAQEDDYDTMLIDEDDVLCKICNSGEDVQGNKIFICDGCDRGVHQNCHRPRIQDSEEDNIDPWVCKECDTANKVVLGAGVKRKWDDAEGMGGREVR
ncbi:hypothetical protein BC937DRAFT_94355 [Endogone sp. FLAS-F59071]|nr:hypothetical protein BC937DRAFT_94355 [Endogone sp. FLAS-F59071]|eukprot:RUS14091.1 hypothetical protein BC937DRAFT_94355 [Endogone sp. FLAS-F59071]